MRVHRPASLSAFLDLAAPFLEQREVQHGLLLGIAASAPQPCPDAYWGLVLDKDGTVACAALRTADRLMLSCENAPGAIAHLTADAFRPELPAIAGPPESVESFARASGVRWRTRRIGHICECRRVVPTRPVPGTLRAVVETDRDLLAQWAVDIASDGGVVRRRSDAEAAVERHIATGSLHVWVVEGRPVSQAAAVGATRNGIRINDVYTQPDMRKRGYAGALVASLTQHLLDAGRAFTFLHTDLANATSNALYQRIGYVPAGNEQVSWRVR